MMRNATMTAMALAAMGIGMAGCGPDDPPPPRVITGLIDATEVDIATKVPGRVKEMKVREGDHVEAGQPLLSLELMDLKARLDQVGATVDAAKARLAMARKGARVEEKSATRDSVQAARHQVEVTRKAYDRASELLEKGALSQSKFDEIEFKFNVSKDQLAMAEAKLDMVMRGARDEEIEALEALVRQGEAGLAEVQTYDREAEQAAPIAGEVAKVLLHKGELAATGYPIVTLVDLTDVWATFAVREDRLAGIRIGDVLQLEVPALGRTVPMTVFHVAVLGDFATWRATSAKDTFDLKSFEVRARPSVPVEGLRPGMTVRWAAGQGA